MKSVLVSGAGIAGPSLAYWLARRGLRCTVVERAPALRVGGQAVDFRGPVHREMLERMEMWKPIHAHQTAPGELVLLARDGSPVATLPPLFMAGDVEIVRGDLCKLLYERTRDSVEYRFDEHVTAIADRRDGVDVTFASGRQETFDLVVGADGLHSGVRLLAFGDERGLLRHHGYRIASLYVAEARRRVRRGLRRNARRPREPPCDGGGACPRGRDRARRRPLRGARPLRGPDAALRDAMPEGSDERGDVLRAQDASGACAAERLLSHPFDANLPRRARV